ncbi:beta-N-acetylhexosaminidase [Pedobacter xixiisoli]|uniref:Glycosyl hydrolase family 20, catalytic domain n=1 Tax=Pedobacter xixiisoli TaxID=1476464 RepID=A0A285ZS55_9SPHI|nr:beta-N-acetylhexosaminidase [Pedobacter xixiisoli]SOD12483.1 Glycosyl hydrolase family 20, catalytic domain [Pedobacter xixiisoli]
MKVNVLSLVVLVALSLGVIVNVNAGKPVIVREFPIKGFHLDLRIQAMKMPALKAFANKLSQNGINTLVMEWEATYPYEKHAVISNKYAYSKAEVKSFIAYCDSLKIDVIPLQQSFGHVEYILKHYRYKDLREDQKDYSQVNPIKEEQCKALFADLFADMVSTHKSPYFHIGGDETYLLGRSKESKRKADSLGMGRLYGDYIKMLCELVVSLGKKPVVWADIALKYPDALKSLPKQTIFIDWNYGWELDRFGDHKKLMESGFEIWGSPAIRSHPDNYFLTDWAKHFNNIKTFIPQGKELGYKGMVMTSWSTSGIYTQIAESHSDFIDLHAIRRVYPISGFNLLIDGFFNAVSSEKPFQPNEFVEKYAADKYGFSKADAKTFWNALKIAPYEINQGKVNKPNFTVKQLADSALLSLNTLKQLKPAKNKNEFSHYTLMSNIRYNYLVTIEVEVALNQTTFKLADANGLLQKLTALNTVEVDQQFKELNADLLHDKEIDEETRLRNFRYLDLLVRLNKIK